MGFALDAGEGLHNFGLALALGLHDELEAEHGRLNLTSRPYETHEHEVNEVGPPAHAAEEVGRGDAHEYREQPR